MARLSGSGSVSLMRLQSSCYPGLQVSGGSTGPSGSPSTLTHLVVGQPQFLAGC